MSLEAVEITVEFVKWGSMILGVVSGGGSGAHGSHEIKDGRAVSVVSEFYPV